MIYVEPDRHQPEPSKEVERPSLAIPAIGLFLTCLLGTGCLQNDSTDASRDSVWTLVWSDDFEGEQLDSTKWDIVVGDGCDVGICGWGNNELEWYSRANVTVSDGILRLTARREVSNGRAFTSGKVQTKNKGDWTYGKIEVRAKLPRGHGTWPAIWMLPTANKYGGWAASGEIDIMEAIGREPATYYATLHHGGSWPDNESTMDSLVVPEYSLSDEFHTYSIIWSAGRMEWFLDGKFVSEQTEWSTQGQPFPAPFDQPFHLILNFAVGGKWPGNPDSTTGFPQSFEIDRVAVYQRSADK